MILTREVNHWQSSSLHWWKSSTTSIPTYPQAPWGDTRGTTISDFIDCKAKNSFSEAASSGKSSRVDKTIECPDMICSVHQTLSVVARSVISVCSFSILLSTTSKVQVCVLISESYSMIYARPALNTWRISCKILLMISDVLLFCRKDSKVYEILLSWYKRLFILNAAACSDLVVSGLSTICIEPVIIESPCAFFSWWSFLIWIQISPFGQRIGKVIS